MNKLILYLALILLPIAPILESRLKEVVYRQNTVHPLGLNQQEILVYTYTL